MEILWKHTVCVGFQAIRLNFSPNCAFPRNFHTRKLGEITVFYAVFADTTQYKKNSLEHNSPLTTSAQYIFWIEPYLANMDKAILVFCNKISIKKNKITCKVVLNIFQNSFQFEKKITSRNIKDRIYQISHWSPFLKKNDTSKNCRSKIIPTTEISDFDNKFPFEK